MNSEDWWAEEEEIHDPLSILLIEFKDVYLLVTQTGREITFNSSD